MQPRTYNEGNTTGKEVIVMTGKKIISLFLALLMAFGVAAGPALAADAQAEMPAAAAEESVNTQVVENLVRALWGVASSLVPKVVDVNQLIDLGVFLVESVVYVMIQALVLQDYSIASERKLAVVARMGGQKWQLTKDIQVSEPIKVTAPIAFKLDAGGHSVSKKDANSRDPIFLVTGSFLLFNAQLNSVKGGCIVNRGHTVLAGGTCVTAAEPGSFSIRNEGSGSLELLDASCSSVFNEGVLKMPEGYHADAAEVVSRKTSHIAMAAGHIGTLRTDPAELNSILQLTGGTIDRYETAQLSGFAWPLTVRGYISSPYGYRTNPVTGAQQFHSGVDISAAGINGKPVLAAESGTVILAENKSTYGNCVMISHNETYVTLYAHCSELYVKAGDTVTRGQTIAAVGATGNATGPHLHFEVRENGVTVDPMNFITMPDA